MSSLPYLAATLNGVLVRGVLLRLDGEAAAVVAVPGRKIERGRCAVAATGVPLRPGKDAIAAIADPGRKVVDQVTLFLLGSTSAEEALQGGLLAAKRQFSSPCSDTGSNALCHDSAVAPGNAEEYAVLSGDTTDGVDGVEGVVGFEVFKGVAGFDEGVVGFDEGEAGFKGVAGFLPLAPSSTASSSCVCVV